MDVKNKSNVSNENLGAESLDKLFELDIRVSHHSSEAAFLGIADNLTIAAQCTTIVVPLHDDHLQYK